MRLYSRAWLRPVRRAVAEAWRTMPEARREARRRMWKTHRTLPGWFFRAVLPVAFALFALLAPRPEIALGAFLLWSLVPLLTRARELQSRLLHHEDAEMFVTLPVDDHWFFRYHLDGIVRASLWLGADAAALYAALLWRSGDPALIPAYACAAVGQWLAALGAAALLFRLWPRAPFRQLAAFWGAALGSGCFYGQSPALFAHLFSKAVAALQPFTPAGWIHETLAAWRAGGGKGLLYAVPVLALIAALPTVRRALRARFRFREAAPDWAPPVAEFGEDDDSSIERAAAQIHSASTATAIAAVEAREWREEITVWQGPLELLARRWLNARERRVFDFLVGGELGWSSAWRTSWAALAMCAAALLVIRQIWPALHLGFLVGLGAWIVANIASPVLGGSWVGLSAAPVGQRFCALGSTLPVGLGEMARVIWKSNTLRLAAALPIYVAYGALAGWILGAAPGFGAILGAKLTLLLLALQPLATIIPFSGGTNDTSGFFHKLIAFLALLILLPVVGLPIYFLVTTPFAGLLAVPVVALVAWIGARLYRHAYERGAFDLLTAAD